MATTLDDILKEVGGYVDQDASTPTGTDLSLRINYANRALRRWESRYDWDELTKTAELSVGEVSCASVSLPADFVKPMSPLYVLEETTIKEYKLIKPDERFDYADSDRFAFVMGNLSEGFTLRVPRGIASGASTVLDYKSRASVLASTSESISLRDPNYLTQSIIADVLESRGDARFQIARFESEQTLANMVEAQNAGNKGRSNSVPVPTSYVIGED